MFAKITSSFSDEEIVRKGAFFYGISHLLQIIILQSKWQIQWQCHLLCRARGGIMALNCYSVETSEVESLKNDLEGFNDVYRDIADEIGIENTLAIYRLFRGTQVSFPNRLFSKEYTHKAIVSEYDGNNISQLAQKYNYSERSIWRILKTIK